MLTKSGFRFTVALASMYCGGPVSAGPAASAISLTPAQICPGDFDGDGRVAFGDFLAFAGGFGTREGNTNFIALMDMDGDGEVGFRDFLAFASVFGTTCVKAPPDTLSDRAVLVALYEATTGENWQDNTNWLSDEPLDRWYGVTTDTDGRVAELVLKNNQLTGTIPSELGGLTNLQGLALDNNLLTGTIPAALDRLSKLQGLALNNNQLTGTIPPELGSLSNLNWLYVNDNQLTGTIPAELGSLNNLQGLALSYNRLTETIPPELGSLSNLKGLYLSNNQLTGTIPAELGSLRNLTYLILSDNQLTGAIPPELGNLSNLSNLTWLILFENQLTGPLPQSLTQLTALENFAFGDNAGLCAPTDEAFRNWLQGIPNEGFLGAGITPLGPSCSPRLTDREILENFYRSTGGDNWMSNSYWLSDRPLNEWHGVTTDDNGNVTVLRLTGNRLTGAIPPELVTLSSLTELYLNGNRLTGAIPPELGNLSNLTWLILFDNQLTGPLPQSLTQLTALENFAFRDNAGLCAPTDETFQNWLKSIPNESLLGAGITPLGPNCSPRLTDRQILEIFYRSTGGDNWQDNTNWLTESPLTLWHGVTTGVTTDSNGNVTGLYLTRNLLKGEIPAELGDLSNLTALYLNTNQLTGAIPPELGKLSSLTSLYLNGNHQLTGPIPPELGKLFNLTLLYLNGNRLTGGIPPELGDLSNLTSLYLNGNRLTGAIPPELGDLSKLARLILTANQLTGPLPLSLTQLATLKLFAFGDNAGLCAPTDEAFQNWMLSIPNDGLRLGGIAPLGPNCSSGLTDTDILENLYKPTVGDN